MQVAIGQKLEIRGRYFLRGRNKNTVVFKRTGGKAIFVKAAIGTTKLLRLTVPAKLKSALRTRAGAPVPTRFRLRVLARKFGKRFTKTSRSPVVGPELPPTPGQLASRGAADGDCDGDGVKNGAETDDDGDLLADTTELRYKTDPLQGRLGRRRRHRRLRDTSPRSTSTTTSTRSRRPAAVPGEAPVPERRCTPTRASTTTATR